MSTSDLTKIQEALNNGKGVKLDGLLLRPISDFPTWPVWYAWLLKEWLSKLDDKTADMLAAENFDPSKMLRRAALAGRSVEIV